MTASFDNSLGTPPLADAIDRQPLIVLPHTSLLNVVKLMHTTMERSQVGAGSADRTEDSIQQPVGIVTERDIVRFQALGVNLCTTPAQAVMSTPLFVLSPEDSLWTAHQEMEQRQVRRLVVSWNWGARLGIVTQTSILRVFDPIEMHNVIETLQHTIQQLGLDLDKVLANAIDRDTHLYAATPTPEPPELPNLNTFLTTLQSQIEHLIDRPQLLLESRQAGLRTLLSNIQQFRDVL